VYVVLKNHKTDELDFSANHSIYLQVGIKILENLEHEVIAKEIRR
jgi:hypothetical protein